MTDHPPDWTEPLGSEYPEPTPSNGPHPSSRVGLAAFLTAAWLVIMLVLAGVLFYVHRADQRSDRADQRAERSGRTVCELAQATTHLSKTLDAGVRVLILTGPQKERATADLRALVQQGKDEQVRAQKACRLASSR